jgi:hypothetical protein
MTARQLAPGWLALVGWLIAWPAAAQAPAAAPASAPARAASAVPPAAPPASAASAPAPTAAASAARPAPAAASAPAAAVPAAPIASAPAASAPARPASRPRVVRKPQPAASAARAPSGSSVTAAAAAEASANAAERAAHERDLEAIRNALLETAVAAPVRVQSFGWIDTQGRLHEDTQFTSDARVRGVRVQAYLEDPNAPPPPPPKVMVDLESLPAGVGRQTDSQPQRCLEKHGRWRQALQVEVVAAAGSDGRVPLEAARLAVGLQLLFTAAGGQSRRWVLQPRPAQGATAYERVLFGREADRADWLARVVLLPRARGLIEAELQLQPLGHGAPSRRLVLPLAPLEASAAVWAERMADWVARLDELTACDPLWFAVVPSEGGLRLRQGAAHGMQPGDRLLLVQRQHLAGRLLEPGAVRAMALLQADDSQGQRLRWLAGPRPGAEGPAGAAGRPPLAEDWVVLPL